MVGWFQGDGGHLDMTENRKGTGCDVSQMSVISYPVQIEE